MPAPVLVTAGATRNPVDAIRYLSAGSSGATGTWVARRVAARAPVHLLASPEAELRLRLAGLREGGAELPDGLTVEGFGSTDDLLGRMERWVRAHPRCVVVHASAVGDYAVAEDAGKIPSGRADLVLALRPTPKIVDRVRGWSEGVHLVSFKAAPPATDDARLEAIARAQLVRTGSGLVFANVIGRIDRGVLLVEAGRTRRFEHRPEALSALVEHILAAAARAGQPK